MRLSQPPEGASYRAHRLLDDDLYVEPGQRLPACPGHRSVSICTTKDGERRGPDKRRSEVHDFPDVCWAAVWRRKHDLEYMLKSLGWRRENIPTGYRRLAGFEAACHWWLCSAIPQGMSLNDHCSCTPEYRAWFKGELFAGMTSPTMIIATTGLAP